MPTKRTPRDRARKPRITDQAVNLFVRCLELRPIYDACVSERSSCRSDEEGVHCAACREYLDGSRELTSLLGLEPWHVCIDDIDAAEPPPGTDAMRVEAWHRVWRLRCELEAEVAKRKAADAD